MKYFFCFTILVAATSLTLFANPSITGKIIDHNGNGLPGLKLQLYINPIVYDVYSGTDGSFAFNNITSVHNTSLPASYSVTDNYPNPFNPTTRIDISLPTNGIVRIDVYNVLGQRVFEQIERYLNKGVSSIDLELGGLPNGCYFAKISIDEKYTVMRKLTLLYGTQHLVSNIPHGAFMPSGGTSDNRSLEGWTLDSLVVTGTMIDKVVFMGLPGFSGNDLNLGNLTIPVNSILQSPTVATDTADSITPVNAVLNGLINPNGVLSEYFFEYGRTANYGTRTSQHTVGSDRAAFHAKDTVVNLYPGSLYHYRIVGINKLGTSYGNDKVFTTSDSLVEFQYPHAIGTRWIYGYTYNINSPPDGVFVTRKGVHIWEATTLSSDSAIVTIKNTICDTVHYVYMGDLPPYPPLHIDTTYVLKDSSTFTITFSSESINTEWYQSVLLPNKYDATGGLKVMPRYVRFDVDPLKISPSGWPYIVVRYSNGSGLIEYFADTSGNHHYWESLRLWQVQKSTPGGMIKEPEKR